MKVRITVRNMEGNESKSFTLYDVSKDPIFISDVIRDFFSGNTIYGELKCQKKDN